MKDSAPMTQGGRRDRILLASIHDVGPRFESEIDMLVDQLESHVGSGRFAMLVVPDHWGEAPLAAAPAFGGRLRRWADSGVEMFLHGWSHRDDGAHRDARTAWKAKHMTAGEGEFLGLSEAEAARRMRVGRKVVEDVIGRPVAGFIAPAWLYGPGAHLALRSEHFPLAEDHLRVWNPQNGAVLTRGPVITWASRSRARIRSSLAFAALARIALQPLRTVRIAVHPGDAHVPPLLRSIDTTFAAFSGRRAAHYSDLLSQTRGAPAERT